MELLGLFLSAFTSATILPGTSETVFGALLLRGHPWLTCLFVASFGNWLGGMTSYALGPIGKWSWLERLGIKENEITKFHAKIETWGSLAALVGWLPFIGDLLMVSLGYFRASFVKTAVFSFAGRFVRYAVIAAVTLRIVG